MKAKIANIEATEDAKQQLPWERMNKKEDVSDFVPSNMAVNYLQHNRFRIDDRAPQNISKTDTPKPAPLRVGDVEKSLNAGGRPVTRPLSLRTVQETDAAFLTATPTMEVRGPVPSPSRVPNSEPGWMARGRGWRAGPTGHGHLACGGVENKDPTYLLPEVST